jgi:4-hydroxy-2-oxoheptanedioate aldolase
MEAKAEIVAICKEHDVVVGHPHVGTSNMQHVVDEGYRFLMCAAPRSFGALDKIRSLTGRS